MAYTPDTMIGGIELKAAGLVAADTNHSAVQAGHGSFCVYLAWTADEVATGDELYIIQAEANSVAATSTWTKIAIVGVFGAAAVIGGATVTPATGALKCGIINPYDYQVRLATYTNGTIATGLNFSAYLFPVENLLV